MNDVMNLRTDYTKNDKNDLEKAVPFPPVEVDQPGGVRRSLFYITGRNIYRQFLLPPLINAIM